MLDEGADAAFVLEYVVAFGALLDQFDLDAGIQERQFAQALGQDVVVEFGLGEYRAARQEAHGRAAQRRGADAAQRILRLAEMVFLLVLAAVAIDRQRQQVRQRVDDRDADAVQAAGNLVRVVVELAAGVQHGHDDFGRRTALLRLHVDRNAAAVVDDADRAVGVDRHDDVIAIAGQRLVDRIVDDLEHHVVQAGAVVGIADVHARALAHRVEALEDLDAAGVVLSRLIAGFRRSLRLAVG